MPRRLRTLEGVGPGALRRCLDVVVSASSLVVVALPLLALALAVRLDSSGPAIFRQQRIGQGGRPFTFYKLRSMHVGASGPDYTVAGDPRVTRLGRVLRRTSLDELPQLWHVLRGQMTLVGPRPETPALAAGYPADCRWVFAHRPGLTGPAQVRLRDADVLGVTGEATDEMYLNQIVPARAAIEAEFLAKPTLWATFRVIADTVRHLLGLPVSPLPRTRTPRQAGRPPGTRPSPRPLRYTLGAPTPQSRTARRSVDRTRH